MLAMDALATNRLHAAVNTFAELDPKQSWVAEWQAYWANFAYALHGLGDYNRELAVAQQARARYPGLPRFVWLEAQALAGLGRASEVQRLVDCCLLPTGAAGVSYQSSVDYARNVALELRAHGYPELARAVLERACAWYASVGVMEDSIPTLRYQRMLALEGVERWGEARSVAEVLLSRGSSVPSARRVIGRAALAAGDSARARAELAWIVGNATPLRDPRLLWDAAALAAGLGERERAVTLLRESFNRGDVYDFWLHLRLGLESLRELRTYRELTQIRD
jgi:tetratricopeptide (TPR) repeat protein